MGATRLRSARNRADRNASESLDAVEESLIGGLHGTVLEIGAGEGANFDQLADDVNWIGLEPNRGDTARLRANAASHGQFREPLVARSEAIPLDNDSVDAVLGTLVLCSVRDQRQALEEIARVLRPGGVFVFTEHVAAARRSLLFGFQRLAAPFTRRFDRGCDPARDTVSSIRRSPLRIVELHEFTMPFAFGLTIPLVTGRAVSA